jgi:hypothetical protein
MTDAASARRTAPVVLQPSGGEMEAVARRSLVLDPEA